MPKYRTLNKEELNILEKDFVQFLVTNGVMANDWELLKIEEPEKANSLIDLFSDIVMEKALSRINYLSQTQPKSILCIQFGKDDFKMRGLIAEGENEINFTKKEAIQNAILNPPKGLKVIGDSKPYEKSRQEDIFVFMNSGFEIDNGKFFHALELSQKQTLN